VDIAFDNQDAQSIIDIRPLKKSPTPYKTQDLRMLDYELNQLFK